MPANSEIDRLIDKQQARWSARAPISVEELLATELADRDQTAVLASDQLVDLIYSEILLREEAGQQPTSGEYVTRFPHLSNAIERQFQLHRALNQTLTPQAEIETDVGADTDAGHETLQHAKTKPDLKVAVRRVPGFELQQVIGRGGAGVVYLARDLKLDRTVVIKFLVDNEPHSTDSAASTDETSTKLLHEAAASASLTHPGIVKVFHIGETDQAPYLVMEHVAGGSLAQRLRSGPLPLKQAVELTRQIALGVQHAHENGIIHRDLKPGNVLLTSPVAEGGASDAKVADFGLAKKLNSDHSLHVTGNIIGTPAYMSPEQARGQTADARSDVYSIGAILFESLSGRSPFQAASAWDILYQVTMDDAVPLRQLNSSLPRDIETICQRCLEKSPERRYPTALALAEDLLRFQNGEPILARPVNAFQRLGKWCRRQPGLAALATISLLLLVTLAVGSTIAAYRFADNNRTILAEQKKATLAEQQAVNDRKVVVDSLSELVNSLYDELSDSPATIATREKIVTAAIDGLSAVTKVKGDAATDRIAMQAHRRIGDLHMLRGDADLATAEFETSVKLARELASANPQSTMAQLDLSRALDDMVTTKIRGADFAASTAYREEIHEILAETLANDPNNIEALRQLANAHARDLDFLWQQERDPNKVVAQGEKAAADVARLLEQVGDDADANTLGLASAINGRLGRSYLESGNLEQADVCFQLGLKQVESAVALEPNSPSYQERLAIAHRMIGVLQTSQGRLEAALASFDKTEAILKAIAERDPSYATATQQIANTMSLRANTLSVLGQIDKLRATLEATKAIHEATLARSPENQMAKSLLAEVHLKLADTEFRQRDFRAAVESAEAVLKLLGTTDTPSSNAVAYFTVSAKAYLGLNVLIDDTFEISSDDQELIPLFLLACMDAERSTELEFSDQTQSAMKKVNPDLDCRTVRELFEHFATLDELSQFFAVQVAFAEARVLSLQGEFIAKQLSQASDQESQETLANQLDAVTELTEAALQRHLAIFPGGISAVTMEPEMEWFRESAVFKQKYGATD